VFRSIEAGDCRFPALIVYKGRPSGVGETGESGQAGFRVEGLGFRV